MEGNFSSVFEDPTDGEIMKNFNCFDNGPEFNVADHISLNVSTANLQVEILIFVTKLIYLGGNILHPQPNHRFHLISASLN